MSKPEPTPEGALLRRVRLAAGLGIAACADVLSQRGIRLSVSRWSQIENGYEGPPGRRKPVRAPAGTLAHMAHAVGIRPDRLESAGRGDAAEVLREILMREDGLPGSAPVPPGDPALQAIMDIPGLPEDVKRGLVAVAQGMRAAREHGNGTERPA